MTSARFIGTPSSGGFPPLRMKATILTPWGTVMNYCAIRISR